MEHKIEAMPTFIFFKGGSEIDRLDGADEEDLKEKIEKYLWILITIT